MKTQNYKRHKVACKQFIPTVAPEKVFPLLCPEREYEWIPTWDCEIVYTESGVAEHDCIFTTQFPGDVKETWYVDRYEPNSIIQFIKISDRMATRYTITLKECEGGTELVWAQTLTALNEKGNELLENFSDEAFFNRIGNLEKLLKSYLLERKE